MKGVNIDNLNKLIKENNINLSFVSEEKEKLINAMNDFNSCYSGSSIEYLFLGPMGEIKNIETISKVIENYSNVLQSVKLSYQQQDSNLKNQTNRINSNL